ncbi:MAG: twitching motility protein [Aquificaceae bacterium]|nr:twitching motility protein [Aquificaceae bacterium]
MNYFPEIIKYLSNTEHVTEIYLAPKAFIIEKRGKELIKVANVVLNPEDIKETLNAMRNQSSFAVGPLGREGIFSLGVQNVGRLRVRYITQRGSYMVHILRVPYQIPPFEKLCPNAGLSATLESLLKDSTPGVINFHGKNYAAVSTFIYSLLQHISVKYSKVIYVLENPLTFLLRHGWSIIIQREVGADIETFEEGLKDAIYIDPHIVYVGYRETIPNSEINRLLHMLETKALILLNAPVGEEDVLEEFKGSVLTSIRLNEEGFPMLNLESKKPQV